MYEGWAKVPVPITKREAEDKILRLTRMDRRWLRQVPARESDIPDDEYAGEFDEVVESDEGQITWCEFVQDFDVVITSAYLVECDCVHADLIIYLTSL